MVLKPGMSVQNAWFVHPGALHTVAFINFLRYCGRNGVSKTRPFTGYMGSTLTPYFCNVTETWEVPKSMAPDRNAGVYAQTIMQPVEIGILPALNYLCKCDVRNSIRVNYVTAV